MKKIKCINMKKIKAKVKEYLLIVVAVIIMLAPILILIAFMGIGYAIATSDLPNWFKFFLLK